MRALCLAGLLFTSLIASGSAASGFRPAAVPEITAGQLPPQARETLQLIKHGGPFPYDKDGTVFGNREGLLPARERGYYREYTVKTPGARDRGARRIVAGGCKISELPGNLRRNKSDAGSSSDVKRDRMESRLMAPCNAGEYYYTSDHYASFRRILE